MKTEKPKQILIPELSYNLSVTLRRGEFRRGTRCSSRTGRVKHVWEKPTCAWDAGYYGHLSDGVLNPKQIKYINSETLLTPEQTDALLSSSLRVTELIIPAPAIARDMLSTYLIDPTLDARYTGSHALYMTGCWSGYPPPDEYTTGTTYAQCYIYSFHTPRAFTSGLTPLAPSDLPPENLKALLAHTAQHWDAQTKEEKDRRGMYEDDFFAWLDALESGQGGVDFYSSLSVLEPGDGADEELQPRKIKMEKS